MMRETEKVRVRFRDRNFERTQGWVTNRSTGVGRNNDSFQHNRDQHHYPGSISFFFTNFPTHYKVEDMWKEFLKWGIVIDVFIAPRIDRFGKKYGFVRFINVQNPKALEVKLDSLWLGTYKLRVNIPVFQRNSV